MCSPLSPDDSGTARELSKIHHPSPNIEQGFNSSVNSVRVSCVLQQWRAEILIFAIGTILIKSSCVNGLQFSGSCRSSTETLEI